MNIPPTPKQVGRIDTYKTNDQTRKTFFTTCNPFEQRFGYHRAIRRGQFIFVSGTTALKEAASSVDEPERPIEHSNDAHLESKVHYPTDAKQQAIIAMERCIDAVEQLGGQRPDIVRVKMFVARHEHCAEIGAAFRECFASLDSKISTEIGATATMIVVQDGFVDPDILVEVEIDAVVLDP